MASLAVSEPIVLSNAFVDAYGELCRLGPSMPSGEASRGGSSLGWNSWNYWGMYMEQKNMELLTIPYYSTIKVERSQNEDLATSAYSVR